MSEHRLACATRNLRARLGDPVRQPVAIICSQGKQALALSLASALGTEGLQPVLVVLETGANVVALQHASGVVRSVSPSGTLVLLIDPLHADWLFAAAGRPDTGLLVPDEHLYCDWLLSYDGLLRILQADYRELSRFRRGLLERLSSARQLHISTRAGTDLLCQCKTWLGLDGEVCMAPAAGTTRGRLVIDGALYDRPLGKPISLEIEDGRAVTGRASVDAAGELSVMLRQDLGRDQGAAVVAEIGLGINPCARACAGIMEAEMARGTAHVGFGENRTLGGCNASAIHIDVGLLSPTITLDGSLLCDAGNYSI